MSSCPIALAAWRAATRAMVCEDPLSLELLARVERIAPSDVPVLISGETGTGKELIARQVHALSSRAQAPFVAVNAAAFSDTLIESELFGHERGAFTGAHTSKPGWFESADGGTLFLDEIGELPLPLQVKLLRVLQEGEVTPVGARRALPVDVRIIAATNVDLRAAIRHKRFREDLFYRLNVASLHLPALRDRTGDILPLVRHFIALHERKLGQSGGRLSLSAAQRLVNYRWPGNVRELENAVRHALLVRRGSELGAADFPLCAESFAHASGMASNATEFEALEQALVRLFERGVPELQARVDAALVGSAYRYCGRNQLETARMLGMSRHVVRARLIEHGELQGLVRHRAQRTGPVRRARPRARPRPCEPSLLRIGYQKLGLLMLVKGCGALDTALAARGVRVEWVEYAGGIQLVEALRSEHLSVAVLGDCPAVFAQAHDVPIVYLAAEPPAPHGTALVVPEGSPLGRVCELRGRRVAVHRAAQAHYLLLRALEEAGVAADEIEIRFEPPERALCAFQQGEIDAWAIWDPWLSSARLDFRARVLRDSTGLLNNSAYHVARRDFAEHHPELIDVLLTHLQLAAQWVKSDPERVSALLAPSLGLSSRALVASLQRELTTNPLSAELIAAQQDLADGLLRLRMIPRAITVADAQWSAGPI